MSRFANLLVSLRVWHVLLASIVIASGAATCAGGLGVAGGAYLVSEADPPPAPLLSSHVFEHACTETLTLNVPQRIDCGFVNRTVRSWACTDPLDGGLDIHRGHKDVTTAIGVGESGDGIIAGDSVAFLVSPTTVTLDCTVGF